MSTSELTRPAPSTRDAVAPRLVSTRLLRSELRLVFRRRRNLILLAVLGCAPILLGVVIKASAPSNDGEGPAFLGQITGNGMFLVFTSLTVALPVFLPLVVSVAAGESIAGEASIGTLRNLLVVPVHRTRLLAVKYTALLAYALVSTLTVAGIGLITGLVLFPVGPVTLLSGITVPLTDALGRALLIALYVAIMLGGVAAIGLFISTLTEVPMAAMAATAVITVTSEILDSIPQLSAIHPYLFTHPWLAFGDLLRSPVPTHGLLVGLGTEACYVAVFLALAWARFTSKDITA
jgi:ABC-2 type transport system permease protein